MKIIAAPIEMVAKFRPNGSVTPARFAYNGKVDRCRADHLHVRGEAGQ